MRLSTFSLMTLALAGVTSALKWADTKYLIIFGDSYTQTFYNVSAGIDSPDPGWTVSNGPNWVEYLAGTFNVTNVKTFNLAFGGATTSNKLVTPYAPFVMNLDQQTQQFVQYLAPKPAGAQWSSDNTLFAIWIGINDVTTSWAWTNVTQADLHSTIMDTYFDQVATMYQKGARSFLFLTVPPMDRSPLAIEGGPSMTTGLAASVQDYNAQLKSRVKKFTQTHAGSQATIFDTSKVFNTLLNQASNLGFVNVTGYADPYQYNNATEPNSQAPGYAPMASYFWLNNIHPHFTVHWSWALAISTLLSGY